MNLISLISGVSTPKSLWITLINWIESGIGNLGWTIILVTALIKLVTTPLDFWVKLNTKRQTLIQQKCAPQIAKLQKKFGADQNSLRLQTQSIYKREGLDMRTGCIVMLINTILSFTIFITFYNDLRKVSAYEAIHQYEQIETTYTDNYYKAFCEYNPNGVEDEFIVQADVDNWIKSFNEMEDGTEKQAKASFIKPYTEYATRIASEKSVDYWKSTKSPSTWLWVQNIWVADASAKPFPSYAALKSIANNTGYTKYVNENINEENYNKIASLISDNAKRSTNGYYILPILAGLVTFLAQYIAELHTKLKNKKANTLAQTAGSQANTTMKMMKFIMPVVMIIFTLSASASFGLYILSSNISSILLGELTTIGIDKITKKQRLQVEEELEKEANRLIRKGTIKE